MQIRYPDALSAVPDFGLAAVFLVTWIAPQTFGERTVSYLMLLMLREFINVQLTPALFGQAPSGEERRMVQRSWAVGVALYLAGAFGTTLPPIPRPGISPAVVAAQHLSMGGLWPEQPWRVVAFGFLHFTGWGLSELFAHRWVSDSSLPPLPSSRA